MTDDDKPKLCHPKCKPWCVDCYCSPDCPACKIEVLTKEEIVAGWWTRRIDKNHIMVYNQLGQPVRHYAWPIVESESSPAERCRPDCPDLCLECVQKAERDQAAARAAAEPLGEDECHRDLGNGERLVDFTRCTHDSSAALEDFAARGDSQPARPPLSYCNSCGRWFEHGVVNGICLNCQPVVDQPSTGFVWGQGWCQPDCPAGCVKCQREAAGMKIVDQPAQRKRAAETETARAVMDFVRDTPTWPITDQPPPEPNDNPAIWDLVIADMRERDRIGRERYGTPLQAGNGRKMLVDAYQEILDLAVYLRGEIEERRKRAA